MPFTRQRALDKLGSTSLREESNTPQKLISQGSKKLKMSKRRDSGLENSLKAKQTSALKHMATRAGKTFTAVILRIVLYSQAKQSAILFLVDRNNSGKQAKKEFDNFSQVQDKRNFSEIYNVGALETNHIPQNPKS